MRDRSDRGESHTGECGPPWGGPHPCLSFDPLEMRRHSGPRVRTGLDSCVQGVPFYPTGLQRFRLREESEIPEGNPGSALLVLCDGPCGRRSSHQFRAQRAFGLGCRGAPRGVFPNRAHFPADCASDARIDRHGCRFRRRNGRRLGTRRCACAREPITILTLAIPRDRSAPPTTRSPGPA
jgi:hypothetical protein